MGFVQVCLQYSYPDTYCYIALYFGNITDKEINKTEIKTKPFFIRASTGERVELRDAVALSAALHKSPYYGQSSVIPSRQIND